MLNSQMYLKIFFFMLNCNNFAVHQTICHGNVHSIYQQLEEGEGDYQSYFRSQTSLRQIPGSDGQGTQRQIVFGQFVNKTGTEISQI